jgi:uncharacterized protein (UPF0210 family)
VGTESAEDDEGQPAGEQPDDESAAAPAPPTLAKAPEVWHETRQVITTHIDQLKAAIRDEFADEDADLLTEVEQNMKKLDRILENLDHKLAESLAKAHAMEDAAARKAELQNAKALLATHIKYVKSEPLIAHIDANPFGVKINLSKMLTERLTHMARAIG